MSAQIDGTPWIATCLLAASWTAGTLSIVATNGTDTITLGAIASIPGSIDLTTATAFASLTRAGGTWTTANSGGTGTLTLSRLDLQGATGTFSFSAPAVPGTAAIGTKFVSGGVFDVTF